MTEKFELLYGYVHCLGKTTYSAGFVDKEKDAIEWVKEKTGYLPERITVPDKDPIRTCPVANCPLKAQRPWYSYRIAEGETE